MQNLNASTAMQTGHCLSSATTATPRPDVLRSVSSQETPTHSRPSPSRSFASYSNMMKKVRTTRSLVMAGGGQEGTIRLTLLLLPLLPNVYTSLNHKWISLDFFLLFIIFKCFQYFQYFNIYITIDRPAVALCLRGIRVFNP